MKPIYLNTDPKVLRKGGRKASRSTSLDFMLDKYYQRYLREYEEPVDETVSWDSIDPAGTYDFLLWLIEGALKKDLSKVWFSAENCAWNNDEYDADEVNPLLGYHQLESGLEFLGIEAGGDWEIPLFFIIYTDGKKLRAYIPTYGNTFNTDTMTAIGSETDVDKFDVVWEKYSKLYPDMITTSFDDDRTFVQCGFMLQFTNDLTDWEARIMPDTDKLLEDIKLRIEVE